MKEMDTDGNLHALKKYQDGIDQAEENKEAYQKKLNTVSDLIEEAESMFNDIQREFEISDETFLDFIGEL